MAPECTMSVKPYVNLRQKLAERFEAHPQPDAYLKRSTAVIDKFVRDCAAHAQLPERCSVAAVGGYGRREMYPFSDIDVAVLIPEGATPEELARVSDFVTSLWCLGLTVGTSVRTKEETIRETSGDITAATAFLEARWVCGDKALFEETYALFREKLDSRMFFRSKNLEMRQRHQKYGDTPYSLEPNIKEGLGGLRDLQVFLWYSKAAGYGSSWAQMARAGLITSTEAYHFSQCLHFLRVLRIRLHLLCGRHEDRLIFDVQTALAEKAGIEARGGLLPSEALMKRFYLNAKNIVQLTEILVAAIAEKLFRQASPRFVKPIDDVFVARGDILDIKSPELFAKDSTNLIRAFVLFAAHRECKRMSTTLLRSLWHERSSIDTEFRRNPVNKKLFLETLKLKYGPYHFLKNLNTWGILGRFLPVWRRIVGQMQHDLFHIYTVDQHTLGVVKFLRRLSHSSYAHEYPLCSQVLAELAKPWRLTLAGLFHDIAKGRGGSHSELGAKEVRRFAADFGLSQEDGDYVEFLVGQHLLMSTVAQREDISNPEVVERFAAKVGSKERLDGLFLLTVCDIRATSPKVWNAWKYQLLTDLYRSALTALGGGELKTRTGVFEDNREKACRLIARSGMSEAVRDAFWKELDIVYFLRHSPQDIAWHTTELAEHTNTTEPLVKCRFARRGGVCKVLVYTPDQKDLFARVVAFFEREGLSVLDARIHTTTRGRALDTFLVQDKRGRDASVLQKGIEKHLAESIESRRPLPEPKKGKLSRRGRNFPVTPIVEIERDESQRSWVLRVTCNDRIGLLFAISVVLAQHGINLATAKISTLDERVEDVFLIDAASLADPDVVVRVESDIIDAVLNAS